MRPNGETAKTLRLHRPGVLALLFLLTASVGAHPHDTGDEMVTAPARIDEAELQRFAQTMVAIAALSDARLQQDDAAQSMAEAAAVSEREQRRVHELLHAYGLDSATYARLRQALRHDADARAALRSAIHALEDAEQQTPR